MRKLLSTTGAAMIALTLSTSSLAASSGFYAGVTAGRDTGNAKTRLHSGNGFNLSLTNAHHFSGFIWGTHVGYNTFLSQHFVLGSELFYQHSNSRSDWYSENSDIQRQLKKTSSYGVSLLPGWQIDNMNRLYARVGWVQSKFDHETNDNQQTLFSAPFQNTKFNGLQLGFGYLVNLTQDLVLRFEYDHSYYEKKQFISGLSDNTYQPNFDQFLVGADYYFNPTITTLNTKNLLHTNSFYVGGTAGYDNTRMELNSGASGNTFTQSRAMQGYLVGFHEGYSWQIANHWVVSPEVFAQGSSSRGLYSLSFNGDSSDTYRLRRTFGAALLPGYKINAANLIYLRLGYVASRFSKDGTANGPAFSELVRGVQYGLGYEVAVATHWSVFGEYVYNNYKSLNTESSGSNYGYDIDSNQYNLGINYRF